MITGAAGQLGRALCAAAPLGIDVVALPRAALDVGDDAAVRSAFEMHRPDLVINAAAYTAVDRAEAEPDAAWRTNARGPALLAEAAARGHSRLIHISTDHVFDGRSSRPYRVDDPKGPLNVYGASKAAGETAVQARLPDALILRTAWLYGATGDTFLRRILDAAVKEEPLRVVRDQVGAPTHAASLARAVWHLAASRAAGTHHFTDDGALTRHGFAMAIVEEAYAAGLLDAPPPVLPTITDAASGAAPRPAYAVLDTHRTLALLGMQPPPWREELRAAIGAVTRHG